MRTYQIALFLSIFLPIFLLANVLSHRQSPNNQATDIKGYTIGRRVMISAFIGNARYTITGYTSPFALVKLEGQGIYNETQADKNGKFTFQSGFSPLTPREVCITAVDTDGRITQPLCLPAFPIKKNIAIGPLILPPTLSINQPEFLIHDDGIMNGLSAPGSLVDINIAHNTYDKNLTIRTQADLDGEYSVTLPTSHKDTVRIYSRTNLDKLESIASNLLSFEVLPWWMLILKWLFEALTGLKDKIATIVIIIEIVALGYLFWYFILARKVAHPLALRPDHFLIEQPPIQSKQNNPFE